MTLTVDASVALKWALTEDGSDRAMDLVGAETLIAPDFLMLECANVLAQHVRRGNLAADRALAFMRELAGAGVRLIPSAPYAVEAHRLGVLLRQSAYDSLYLAVAIAEGATLITADARFAVAVEASPAHKGAVRRL